MSAFEEIKHCLCSDRVLVLYDTRLNTWLYLIPVILEPSTAKSFGDQ